MNLSNLLNPPKFFLSAVKKNILQRIKFAMQANSLAPVLIYHAVEYPHVNPMTSGEIHNVYPDILYEQFLLLKKHFKIITIDEMVERIESKKKLSGIASITFDDGYVSVLNNAVPILENLEIPATIFLTTKLIQSSSFWRDKIRYIINENRIDDFLRFANNHSTDFQKILPESFYRATKDPSVINSQLVEKMMNRFFESKKIDLKQYAASIYCCRDDLLNKSYRYLTFGNHTHSHYVLSSLEKDEQYEEITRAENILKKMCLSLSKVFSIPFGQQRDFNDDTIDILHQLDYVSYAMSSGAKVVNAYFDSDQAVKKYGLVSVNRFMPENKKWLFN